MRGFVVGEDTIDLSALGITSITTNSNASADEVRFVYSGNTDRTYILSDAQGFSFYLEGDYRGQLSADDIIFADNSNNDTSSGGNDTGSGGNSGDALMLTNNMISAYDDQDENGSYALSHNGTQIDLTGNTWKKVDIADYTITDNTVLTFEYRSTQQGEIQGIGFDTDNDYNNATPQYGWFKLYGTQSGVGNSEYQYDGSGNWQSFTIDVSDYIGTGTFDYLTLLNDHDNGSRDATGGFRNLWLEEEDSNGGGSNGQFIEGTDGRDTLTGTDGDDTLDGGAGRDTLEGGNGADLFRFSDTSHSLRSGGDGRDRIIDFEDGIDSIDVSALGFTHLRTQSGGTEGTDLRIGYASQHDATYIVDDITKFEIFLSGDIRSQIDDTDFMWS